MKLKYLFLSAALLSLTTGCNDSFLDRAPQELNDASFWQTVNDLKTYANSFYTSLPGGVFLLMISIATTKYQTRLMGSAGGNT